MTPTIHAIGLILYAVGAVAAGLWLVQGALALPPILAATSAGCLFVFVALAHESFVRRGDRDDILDELDGLQRTNAELTARLEEATSEIERIKKAVADGDWKAHEEVVGEMRVLQGLLHRFAGKEAPIAVQADDELEPLRDRIDRRIPEVLPDTLSNKEILGIVQKGLQENRVDVYLQPVVVLPQRKTRFYEAFSRIRNEEGSVIVPEQYLSIAAQTGLLATIDNLLLFRCVQLIRRVQNDQLDVGFFCNLSSHNMSNANFFPQFVDFMQHNAQLASSLKFELSQDDVVNAGVTPYLRRLAAIGFRFSMGKISSLNVDYVGLAQRGFRFMKVDAGILLSDPHQIDSPIHIEDLKVALKKSDIDLIAEEVESEQQVIDLLDLGLELAQGYLFGEPRLSRDAA
ncbi:MAG: hypothetical protein CL569_08890 [Alphaproteobacteria bacterium]|nr:hypothetical protein [Alphaproteobacteria bacterium]